jgi:hypothetical protein
MQMPNVRSSIRDAENNVTYHVLAYRRLSKQELIRSVARYQVQPSVRRRKKPLKNQEITIITIHGATPGL